MNALFRLARSALLALPAVPAVFDASAVDSDCLSACRSCAIWLVLAAPPDAPADGPADADVPAVEALLPFTVTAPWVSVDTRSANRSPPPVALLAAGLLAVEAAACARAVRRALSAEI